MGGELNDVVTGTTRVARCAVANAGFRFVRNFLSVFGRVFVRRVPARECEQRYTPTISVYGFKEAIPAGEDERRVAVNVQVRRAPGREGRYVNPHTAQYVL